MQIEIQNSPNQGSRNGNIPDIIVCHITEGNFDGAVATLKDIVRKVSANFIVSRTGRVVQLVPIDKEAYCNGTQCENSHGANYNGRATSKLVLSRHTNANYYTISIEHEGFSKDGGTLTEVQLQATVDLMKWIKSEVKRIYNCDIILDREHIIGHYQIDPINKPLCPGLKFPFDEILKRLNPVVAPVVQTPSIVMMYVIPDKGNWTIFQSPNNTSKVLGKIKPGQKYEVYEGVGNWCHIKAGPNYLGYVDWKAFK